MTGDEVLECFPKLTHADLRELESGEVNYIQEGVFEDGGFYVYQIWYDPETDRFNALTA